MTEELLEEYLSDYRHYVLVNELEKASFIYKVLLMFVREEKLKALV